MYVNGKREGMSIRHPNKYNGKVTTEYVNDLKHGFERTYYKNGQLSSEIPYKDGEEHGVRRTWYEGGEKMSETTMVNGRAHGNRYLIMVATEQ